MSSARIQTSFTALRRGIRPRLGAAWLLVFVVIGYPIAGLMASAMDWDSTTASIPLRVLVLVLSVWLLLSRRNGTNQRGGLWLGLFCGAYLLRLLTDTGITQVPGAVEALVFFLATVVIPAVALWKHADSFSEVQAQRLMFTLGSGICISILGMSALGVGQSRSIAEISGRLSFEALNPISVGHTAVSTMIAALCMVRTGLSPKQAPMLIAGSVAALTTLLMAASRGPLLCLVAAGLVYVMATGRWFWVVLISLALAPFLFAADSEMLMRFTTIQEDTSALERLAVQSNAVDQFLSQPILGSAFVELTSLSYPHNLFLETAMALGILGLLLLVAILAKAGRSFGRQIKEGQLLIPLLFVQYLMGAQFSGSIYANGPLAACLVLLVRHSTRIKAK